MSVRQGKMEKIALVIGVIGADVHAIGNKILEDAFSHAGFKVVNIGVLSSQEEFIQAAIKSKAEAILVSSLYGQAEIDCLGMRQGCIEAGLDNILLYIGGNIVVGKQRWEEVEARFKELGFDRVYPPGTSPLKAIKDLRKDLKMERRDEESSSQ